MPRSRRLPSPPEVCPVCGTEVPRNALACPECGADDRSGWREDADAVDSGLPDDDFDYEEFVKNEFGNGAPSRFHLGWWITAILLLLAFALWLLLSTR